MLLSPENISDNLECNTIDFRLGVYSWQERIGVEKDVLVGFLEVFEDSLKDG